MRVVTDVPRAQPILVVEQHVVHVPELALRRGRLGGLGSQLTNCGQPDIDRGGSQAVSFQFRAILLDNRFPE